MILPGIRFIARAAACVALVALVAPNVPAASAHTAGAAPNWLVNNAKTKTATITLIAAYKGGFDFNGYAQGKMAISVPAGYHVNVVFSNAGTIPHSAVFTAYAKRTAPANFPVAFKGATSPNATSGVTKGTTQKFSFVANKVGPYAIVCAVPGHATAGMWDTFTVIKSGSPSIKFTK
jgi:sulfocyanin